MIQARTSNTNPNSARHALIRCIVLSALILSCSVSSAAPAAAIERIHAHVSWLADSARQGRRAGTQGAVDSANYIAGQFRDLGFDVQMQEFGGNRRNVVARLGSSPSTIVAGAHYDGQGPGFPSASDNAAGAAVLLEVARDLSTAKLPVSIVMVAFDDEEQGLNGSQFWVEHPTVPLDSVRAAVVFDSLGRHFIDLREWTMIVLGTENSAELSAVLQKNAKKDMLNVGTDLIGPRSDFAAFAMKRVPFLFFSDGTFLDYHGTGDTADRVDYTRLAQESQLIGKVIRDTAKLKTRPMYRQDPVYPDGEINGMLKLMRRTAEEKKELPSAYRQALDELKTTVPMDTSRESIRIATSVLLAVATPAHSRFFLEFELEPYFESINKPAIAAAMREEAARSGR